jgi:hypothetical protein
MTKDGGNSCKDWNSSGKCFEACWLMGFTIVASQHKKKSEFVTLNGYRNDDFTSYVYVSDDYGTWTNISKFMYSKRNYRDSKKRMFYMLE